MSEWIKDNYNKKAQPVFQTVLGILYHKKAISSPVQSYKYDVSLYHNSHQPKELHHGNPASNPDNLFA